MSKGDMTTTIEIGGEEIDCTVDYEITSWGSSGRAASLTYPGDPPEAPEYEITRITRDDTDAEIEYDSLTQEAKDKLEQGIFEKLCEQVNEPDEPYDYDY